MNINIIIYYIIYHFHYYMSLAVYCFGDAGSYSADLKYMISRLNNNINKIFVLAGDNFYPVGLNTNNEVEHWDKYHNVFKNVNKPIYAILGNHDYYGNTMSQIYSNNWSMPYYYYYRKNGDIGMWFLDTQILDPGGSKNSSCIELQDIVYNTHGENSLKIQIQWLQQSLEEHKTDKYKIVFGHYPLISSGAYTNNELLIKILMPLFITHNVNAYVSGHDHNIQHKTIKYGHYIFNQIISGCSDSSIKYSIQRSPAEFFGTIPGGIKIAIIDSELNLTIFDKEGKILYNIGLS